MKWYAQRLDELQTREPVYSACGDDCSVCPRFLARTDEELHETAVFWYEAGWRDHIVTNEEISCAGCGCGACSFGLIPCLRQHGVDGCQACVEYPCAKIGEILAHSRERQASCRAACESEAEFSLFRRAFYEKERNLAEKPCRIGEKYRT